MGFEEAIGKAIAWGYGKGLKGIEKQIQKVIKQNRLVFLGDNKILFTDKRGKKREYTFDKMASKAIEDGGWADQMVDLGLTIQDIKDILTREYEKQKKDGK